MFFLCCIAGTVQDVFVHSGDTVNVKAEIKHALCLKCVSIDTSHHVTSSCTSQSTNDVDLFYVNRESVGKLNNAHLSNLCTSSIRNLRRSWNVNTGSKLKLGVLSKDVYLFPINCLRTGLVDEVCFVGLNHLRRNITQRLIDLNVINPSRVAYQNHLADCTSLNDCQLLWVDVVDNTGCMRQNILRDITVAR